MRAALKRAILGWEPPGYADGDAGYPRIRVPVFCTGEIREQQLPVRAVNEWLTINEWQAPCIPGRLSVYPCPEIRGRQGRSPQGFVSWPGRFSAGRCLGRPSSHGDVPIIRVSALGNPWTALSSPSAYPRTTSAARSLQRRGGLSSLLRYLPHISVASWCGLLRMPYLEKYWHNLSRSLANSRYPCEL